MITVNKIMPFFPCSEWPEKRVSDFLGTGLEPLDLIARIGMGISSEDCIWVLTIQGILSKAIVRSAARLTVRRAVTNYILHYGTPKIELWAQRWLSETDNTLPSLCIIYPASAVHAMASVEWYKKYSPDSCEAWEIFYDAALAAYEARLTGFWSPAAQDAERVLQVEDFRVAINRSL